MLIRSQRRTRRHWKAEVGTDWSHMARERWQPEKHGNMFVLTEKYSHNLKAESYFIWWEYLGLRAGETASQ